LDAPGHRNYIPMMIDGATQADVAILVISARSGEFESGFTKNGQTREHIILAKTLGIQYIVVVVNKMDDSTVNWSEERFNDIKKSINSFLNTVGYRNTPFIPLSGYNGINIAGDVNIPTWYSGKSLINTLDDLAPIERDRKAPVVISVSCSDNEFGKCNVNAKLLAGTLHLTQKLFILPGDQIGHVSAIYPEYGSLKLSDVAYAGDNIRLTLDNLSNPIPRGFILCAEKDSVSVCSSFFAEIQLLTLPAESPIFCAGYRCIVHAGCTTTEAEIGKLIFELDKTGQRKKKNPAFVRSSARAIVQITVPKQIVVEVYAKFQHLGRITLRVRGDTIAFGKILKCS